MFSDKSRFVRIEAIVINFYLTNYAFLSFGIDFMQNEFYVQSARSIDFLRLGTSTIGTLPGKKNIGC